MQDISWLEFWTHHSSMSIKKNMEQLWLLDLVKFMGRKLVLLQIMEFCLVKVLKKELTLFNCVLKE
jgi:hypothetical protein